MVVNRRWILRGREKERGKSTANGSCIIAKRIGAMISVCLLFRSSFATKQLYALPTISTIFVAFVLFLSRSLLFPIRCSLSLSPSIRHTYPVLLVLPSPYLPFSATFSSASFTSSCPLLPLRHTSKRLGDTADRTD